MPVLHLKALLLLQENKDFPYHTAPHLPGSSVPESSGEHWQEINLSSWSLSEGPAPKGNPEFISAAEIAVPNLLQFDLKAFWPWAPCLWHDAAQTVQSQGGLRSILASQSRTGESEYKLSVLDLKTQRFYFLNNRSLMQHGRGHLVTVQSRKGRENYYSPASPENRAMGRKSQAEHVFFPLWSLLTTVGSTISYSLARGSN